MTLLLQTLSIKILHFFHEFLSQFRPSQFLFFTLFLIIFFIFSFYKVYKLYKILYIYFVITIDKGDNLKWIRFVTSFAENNCTRLAYFLLIFINIMTSKKHNMFYFVCVTFNV